jgi:hypothetical protein
VISQNGFLSVQRRSAEPNRTGGEPRLTGTASDQRALTNNRRPITRLVNRISGALDWVAETSIAFHTTANTPARVERFQQGKFETPAQRRGGVCLWRQANRIASGPR